MHVSALGPTSVGPFLEGSNRQAFATPSTRGGFTFPKGRRGGFYTRPFAGWPLRYDDDIWRCPIVRLFVFHMDATRIRVSLHRSQ